MPMNCSVALKLLPLASYKFYSSKGEHYYEKKLFNLCHTDFCNELDDASLNQIVSNIEKQLEKIEKDSDGAVSFEVTTENCMADATVLDQIIANFIADDVDLMVGVATPVAMAMQAATEDNEIPVVFAAVSDPVSTGLVESMKEPGANITGTSDYLDTTAVMDLLFAADEEADHIALLYDQGQDSSTRN